MEGVSLHQLCYEVCGVRASLGTRIADGIRIQNAPTTAASLTITDIGARDRLKRFAGREGLNSHNDSRSRRLLRVRQRGLPNESNIMEDVRQKWAKARQFYASGYPEQAAMFAAEIKRSVAPLSNSFARRLNLHCDALLLDAAPKTDIGDIEWQVAQARTLAVRYGHEERDHLGTAIVLLSIGQMERTLAFADPSSETVHLQRALDFTQAARDTLASKCNRGYDRQQVGAVSSVAIFYHARLLEETDELIMQAFAELSRLRDSADCIGGGLGLIQRARAEASCHLAVGNCDRSAQAIAELCWLFHHVSHRSPVSFYGCLGRIIEWARQRRRKFDIRDYDSLSATQSYEPVAAGYTAHLQTLFHRSYTNLDAWRRVSAPGCYLSRLSSLYLEPRLDRLE